MTAPFAPPDDIPVLDGDPFDEATLRDPIAFQQRLREAGPVAWLSRYGFYDVGRYEPVATVMADWRTFSSARGVGVVDFATSKPWWREPAVLIESDPPRHNEIRVRVARVLSSRAVEDLRSDFVAQADALLDRVLQPGTFDAQHQIAMAYPLKVFGDAIGIDDDRRELLIPFGDLVFNNFGPDNATLQAATARCKDLGVVDWMMQKTSRTAVRPGSLGDRLHALSEDGYLTPAEAWNVMRGQLSAGVDTTIAALGHTLMCLASDPQQYAALRDDPTLVRGAFEEAVRHLTPLQTIFRTITTDTAIDGTTARADHKIMVSLGAANRDPRKWLEPDRFDLRRDASGHVAFGRGVHVCVGMHVARLEAECLLTAFARRVKSLELAGVPVYGVSAGSTWSPTSVINLCTRSAIARCCSISRRTRTNSSISATIRPTSMCANVTMTRWCTGRSPATTPSPCPRRASLPTLTRTCSSAPAS